MFPLMDNPMLNRRSVIAYLLGLPMMSMMQGEGEAGPMPKPSDGLSEMPTREGSFPKPSSNRTERPTSE